MSPWLLIPLFALVSVFQTTVVPKLAVAGYRPDVALILVVTWGLLSLPGEAAPWGFAAGIFLDLASGLPFGTQTLALTTVGMLMGLLQTNIFRSNLLLPPAAMVLATVVYNLMILAVLNTLGWQIDWSTYLLRVTLPTAFFNTLALPLAYLPLQKLYRRLRPRVEW